MVFGHSGTQNPLLGTGEDLKPPWGVRIGHKVGLELVKNLCQDFPSDPVVKNSSASAGDTGSVPGPRRSQVLQGD